MLEQIHFTARLRLRSDLHIGTGESRKLSELRSRPEGMVEDPEVALIVRAADETPIIPATALKGALRKSVLAGPDKKAAEETAERLFGAIKHTEWNGADYTDMGRIGCVWLRFAPMKEPAAPGDRLFWKPEASTIITTHVAIARRTGTAADKKLFHVEQVPKGAVFKLCGVFIGTRAEAAKDLPLAFAALAQADGLTIGADGKAGGGCIAVEGALECRERRFDAASGEIVESTFDIPLTAGAANDAAVRRLRLTIFCRGPYMTVDPAKARTDNVIPAARRNDAGPLLSAASLLGVLRTRAAWLAVTDDTGDGDDYAEGLLRTGEDPRNLTRTQRLFGVAGWRGLVRVVGIDAAGDGACERLPGVAIDRFSGGTLDSALYATESFAGVRFAITLQLDRRRRGQAGEWPRPDDIALFDALIGDLKKEGLMLGHAVNRGFGWFSVKKVENLLDAARAPQSLQPGEASR